jgi:uncharacterized membrane protein
MSGEAASCSLMTTTKEPVTVEPTEQAPAPTPEQNHQSLLHGWRKHPGVRSGGGLTLGERAADRMRNSMGSWVFVFGALIFLGIWMLSNKTITGFDKYPFILLNLMFSTQAAYAAPLILLAQNRQADRDKAEVERDRDVNSRALAEAEYLAREIAAVRLAVEQKADRDDVIEPLERLTAILERIEQRQDEAAAED